MSEYHYDDQGQFFPFFTLTMAGLITLPLTYNVFKPSTGLEQTGTRIQTDFKPQHDDLIQQQRQKQKRKQRKTKRIISMVIGYGVMAYMIYLIVVTQRTAVKIWDPYDILGVSRSATEKEIDKFYKRLSVKFHPDKARPDPAKNETAQIINDRWVELTKAYKALTDEDIRNNYLMYGNPDGRQSTSMGIALPTWMVEEGNRWFVMAFYAIVLGIVIPYNLGKWWYGTQALTKDKVLHASAGSLFQEWKEDVSESDLVGALSVGDEFKDTFKGTKGDAGLAKAEGKVVNSGLLTKSELAKLKSIDDPVQRKTLCLLWAYLHRIDLGDSTLEQEKYSVAPTAILLNKSFASITLAFGAVQPLMTSFRTSQRLIQALPPGASPMLQLPHLTPELASKVSGTAPTSTLPLQKFMSLSSQTRRSLLSDLSDSQYQSAMKVASQIPHLQIAKAFFKVVGDRVVTPGSLVQLIVKARIIPPGSQNVPAVNSLDLEDIDPDEGDLDALHGRKPAKSKRRKTAEGKVIEDDSKEDSVQPPLAYAPYFAGDHAPHWQVFLADSRQGRIAVPPFTFTAFDRPIFKDDGTPTYNMQTLRCQFQAPPQVAGYPFTMHLVCDSYIGMDSKVDIILDVRDVAEANDVAEEDDISEPDEDSLAGQLQAMKTGAAPAKKKKVKKPSAASSDEDESDTDGSAAEETSETDTETEDEAD